MLKKETLGLLLTTKVKYQSFSNTIQSDIESQTLILSPEVLMSADGIRSASSMVIKKSPSNARTRIHSRVILFGLFLLSIAALALRSGKQILQTSKPSNDARENKYIIAIQEGVSQDILNVCLMPKAESLCRGNLGIPTAQMPQLNDNQAELYYDQKQKNGFKVKPLSVRADKLTPIENEIDGSKILEMYHLAKQGEFDPCAKEIPVSRDNKSNKLYIIDGHHHSRTCVILGGTQRIRAIYDAPMHILEELKSFKDMPSNSAGFFKQRNDKDLGNGPKVIGGLQKR